MNNDKLANQNLYDLSTDNLYDGSTAVTNEHGQALQVHYKTFGDVDVIFDDYGIAWLNAANIAKLLDIDVRNIASALNTLNTSILVKMEEHIIMIMINTSTGPDKASYERLTPFYDSHVINIIAAKMRVPTLKAAQFLEWREVIFREHQHVIHQSRLQAAQKVNQISYELEQSKAANEFMARQVSDLEHDLNNEIAKRLEDWYPDELED